MKSIESLLNSLSPLEPLSTGILPEYAVNRDIKCVLFDIYGTLLISSSGDIDQTELSASNLQHALESSNINLTGDSSYALETILSDLDYIIKICHQEAQKNDIPFPEIDILSIWEIVLMHARRKKLIAYNGDANIMQMTCIFEFLSNRVYPMPGMQQLIKNLSLSNIPIGIISNAQFYTPVLLNFFLEKTVSFSELVSFFDPELTVFSYKLGIGKPDNRLFKEIIPVLNKKYGLVPSQVLFVGNDMLKDIYTSNSVGFKTALFAGDRRSLRMQSSDLRIQNLKPDFIITELKQITEILA